MTDFPADQPLFLAQTDDEVEEQQPQTLTADMLREILASQNELTRNIVREAVAPKGQPLQQELVVPELAISFEGLPDLRVDPDGYHQEIARRYQDAGRRALTQTVEQAGQIARNAATDQAVQDRALGMIKDAAPELPDELIAVASQAIANQLQAQGEDPRAALRSRTQEVAQSILDYADNLISQATGGQRLQRGEAHRTGGMVAPRRRQPSAPKQEAPDPGDFLAEMKAEQKRLRIYG